MRKLEQLNLEMEPELECDCQFGLLPARVSRLFAIIFASNEMPQLRWV